MKNTLFILAIAILSILNSSCDKEAEVQPKPLNSISIKMDHSKRNTKSGDDDDPIPTIPTLKATAYYSDGTLIQNANVELLSQPESSLLDQSGTNDEGEFIFYDVQKGSYLFVIKLAGSIIGSQELRL